jgi:hypothetical protein
MKAITAGPPELLAWRLNNCHHKTGTPDPQFGKQQCVTGPPQATYSARSPLFGVAVVPPGPSHLCRGDVRQRSRRVLGKTSAGQCPYTEHLTILEEKANSVDNSLA